MFCSFPRCAFVQTFFCEKKRCFFNKYYQVQRRTAKPLLVIRHLRKTYETTIIDLVALSLSATLPLAQFNEGKHSSNLTLVFYFIHVWSIVSKYSLTLLIRVHLFSDVLQHFFGAG